MTSGLGPNDYERALAAVGLLDVPVYHRHVTGSTNDDARAIVASDRFEAGASPALVIAETQTKGRGRGGNRWFSPEGSISMTLIVSAINASRLGTLPLAVGASVAEALQHQGVRACVKWPNDILIDGLKVCGILCESSLLGGTARVFIGIGINVDAQAEDPEVALTATTLQAHGLGIVRPALVADITARVLSALRHETSGEDVVMAWKSLSVPWWGEEVTLLDGGVERRVALLDVNPLGQLIVRDEEGVARSLASGEIRRLRRMTP